MKSLEDIYNKLKENYQVNWNDKTKNSFTLYIGNDKNKYKIYVDNIYIDICKKKKLFKYEYWTDITHSHYDNNDSNFDNLYDGLVRYIKKYSND